MAITCGFFNSLNGDRVYNADDMSTYFKGLISDGVYESVGGALQVLAGSGMNVNVQTGRAIINSKWMENDAVLTLPITAAHVTLNRYTSVVIHLDLSARTISIITIDGTPATNPLVPTLTNGATVKELCLANVYVAAGTTSITQANISDTRANNNVCGWVTGLVEQVDTTTLFNQWQAAYNENIAEMEDWETTQKAAFDSWMSTLTSELQIGAYIKQYKKVVTIAEGDSVTISLDMTGYTYNPSDVFFITINGLTANESYDYTINVSGNASTVQLNLLDPKDELIEICVLKSVLGVSS